ncbi:MAG: anion transporter [Alphaproteobacteria bacterium]|nr:anion transporter [Alphaproteobacteria bacterium]
MDALILSVFGLTYLGMALGRVPGLKVDRTGIALMGVVVLLATGRVPVETIGRAIDLPTLLLLFALMIVSSQFQAAGFYGWVAGRITSATGSPRRLLLLTVVAAAGLSAVLANDIVCFAMAPILAEGARRRGLDPRPFLIGLAGAANAGSAMTVIGNPQNILIGQSGGLDFWRFVVVCGPPGLVATGLVFAVVAWRWRAVLDAPAAASPASPPPAPDRWQTAKGLLAVVALAALFATSLPREIGALVIAASLLASRRLGSREMIGAVDWHLLLLFACLFVVTESFAGTGLAAGAAQGIEPGRLGVMAPLMLAASNTIGNVPAVMLLLSVWPAPSETALHALAVLSTLAGNLLLVGSLANIIVAERAATAGVVLTFRDHAASGIPMTLASMAVAVGWFLALGMAW